MVGSVAVLADSDEHADLLPWILGLGFLFVVALTAAIFVLMAKNPSKLMLGQVTGAEYADIQRVVMLGDSRSGERIHDLDAMRRAAMLDAPRPQLEARAAERDAGDQDSEPASGEAVES